MKKFLYSLLIIILIAVVYIFVFNLIANKSKKTPAEPKWEFEELPQYTPKTFENPDINLDVPAAKYK